MFKILKESNTGHVGIKGEDVCCNWINSNYIYWAECYIPNPVSGVLYELANLIFTMILQDMYYYYICFYADEEDIKTLYLGSEELAVSESWSCYCLHMG